jgi:hypothetical protein
MTQPDAGTTSAPDSGSAPAIDLTGVWAVRVVSAQVLSVPVFGDAPSNLTDYSRAVITQNGNTAQITLHTCKITTDPLFGFSTVYPQAAIDAIPDMQITASIPSTAIGANYAIGPFTWITGWTSNNPTGDALPTNQNDPRVEDQDYVVGRTTASLQGSLQTADHIQGLNNSTTEQYLLDSSSFLLSPGEISAMQDPDPSKSTVDLVRMSGTGNACTDIIRNVGTIFP